MNLMIVTDAWEPQINGVVRTLKHTQAQLERMGYQVTMLTPEDFRTLPCPGYKSIPLAIFPYRKVAKKLASLNPDAIHIATEGPLGMAARRWCLKHKRLFTSSYHTQFPEYLRLRLPIPLWLSYAWFRHFHRPAVRTLVPTASQKRRLEHHGFKDVVVWGRGVDTTIFTPDNPATLDLPRPIFVNMGRVAVEKNIEAFLQLKLPGSKLVIGDGPDLQMLQKKYPTTTFVGAKFGTELASWLSACDVFVFPSQTDTFGLVLLEAMACGLPIAAYPVTGPADIVQQSVTGILNQNLHTAALQALDINRHNCIDFARQQSWQKCTEAFADYMHDNNNTRALSKASETR